MRILRKGRFLKSNQHSIYLRKRTEKVLYSPSSFFISGFFFFGRFFAYSFFKKAIEKAQGVCYSRLIDFCNRESALKTKERTELPIGNSVLFSYGFIQDLPCF